MCFDANGVNYKYFITMKKRPKAPHLQRTLGDERLDLWMGT